MNNTWRALRTAFDNEEPVSLPFDGELDRRRRRERVDRAALVAYKAISGEAAASCAIPDCEESAVLGYCSTAHADDHAAFREWKRERDAS